MYLILKTPKLQNQTNLGQFQAARMNSEFRNFRLPPVHNPLAREMAGMIESLNKRTVHCITRGAHLPS